MVRLAAKCSTVPFSAAIVVGVGRSPTRSSSGDHKKNQLDGQQPTPLVFLMIEMQPLWQTAGTVGTHDRILPSLRCVGAAFEGGLE